MTLLIKIKDHRITLFLKKDGEVVDKLAWQDNRDLLEKLLPRIDKLLRRNGVTPAELEEVREEIEANKSHSSYRIAKAVAETLRLAIEKNA